MVERAHIFQINRSDGGVPKGPVREGQVTALGLEGDRHNDTVHHGGPQRALCLYALERIVDLQAEGHPIYPGSTGENVTVVGLDWAQVVPGTRLRLGEEVVIEITLYTTPCQKIAASFAGGQIRRMSQDEHPGWSRAYARVLSEGRIEVGDGVTVERGA
jgi:MOSC domain-containing protein YiiM